MNKFAQSTPVRHPGVGEITNESLLSISDEPEEPKAIVISGSNQTEVDKGNTLYNWIPEQVRNDKLCQFTKTERIY